MNTPRIIWTDAQEQRLLELQSQKAAAMAANREPVLALAQVMVDEANDNNAARGVAATYEFVTDFFITNATALRAALVPFDREAS